MPRYTAIRPKAWDDEEWIAPSLMPDLTVDEAEPEFIGILDADGNPIFRMPNPIGFGRDDEW